MYNAVNDMKSEAIWIINYMAADADLYRRLTLQGQSGAVRYGVRIVTG